LLVHGGNTGVEVVGVEVRDFEVSLEICAINLLERAFGINLVRGPAISPLPVGTALSVFVGRIAWDAVSPGTIDGIEERVPVGSDLVNLVGAKTPVREKLSLEGKLLVHRSC